MLTEQILIFIQIILLDLVLAGDNAIIIGMVASQFPNDTKVKKINKKRKGSFIKRETMGNNTF